MEGGFECVQKCRQRHEPLCDLLTNFTLQCVRDKEIDFFLDFIFNHYENKTEYFNYLLDFVNELESDIIFETLQIALQFLEGDITAMIYVLEIWLINSENFNE